MKCLIIAAGFGSRLREVSDSKPLTPIAGVPLIEHIVRRSAAGGATSFVVVTGHEADAVEAFVAGLSERTGLPIECVRTADWSLPNGYSVMSGIARANERFILLMSDHIFDPAILAGLIASAPQGDELRLAVDRRLDNPAVDLEDVTCVATDAEGRIVRIGKLLETYDCFDTGIFTATPALGEAIAASIAAGGKGSLSEGVKALAERGLASTFDAADLWWLDVDDRKAYDMAEAALS
ncbi:MAG: NTP transferase domain-containing protein [Candidatus Andeanibacterium colombiense]|uniref:NTP transferase domain-containing protein n=1 Tax=Candidatus Andeanibacterium colombiense TaxID=3121345 RepID=A0AAJ5X862_9SPHN|nr:MAG: NTP transferase domain-containing protein [Sphingomonadaceae bacterium]